jgi:multidrug efflux system outer membrane protein
MRVFRHTLLCAAALALTGCNFAPAYAPPQIALPVDYKELGDWTPAAPADHEQRGAWWKSFNDPVLDDLLMQVGESPSLAIALARHDQANAFAAQSRSNFWPELDADGSAVRMRSSGRRPGANAPSVANDYKVGLSAAYELDLWGRVRNLVRAGNAVRDASAADLESVRLSLQVQTADLYLLLRGIDEQIALLDATVEAYTRAERLTEDRYNDGVASGVDVGRARTQLFNTRAQRTALATDRALAEHALAALIGAMPSTFSLPAKVTEIAPPAVPVAAPSVLLQRRPDIASAERRMYAANARIGVARAAFFPDVSISASGGYETATSGLFTKPASFWALGPAAAGLSLFDGGARRAGVDAARAAFDEAAAAYRMTVLGAFRDVEDQMAQVNGFAQEAADRDNAVVAAARTNQLAQTRYNEGAASFLEAVIAQTAELDARRAALALNTRRLQAAVDLIRAMGGGWVEPHNVAQSTP